MAYTANTPLAANVIATDITNMRANFTHLVDVITNFATWDATTAGNVLPKKLKAAIRTSGDTLTVGEVCIINSSTGAVTMNLPDASDCGVGTVVGMLHALGSNTVTMARAGSDTIDLIGANFVSCGAGHVAAWISDGSSNWVRLFDIPPVVDVVCTNSPEDTNENDLATTTFASGAVLANDHFVIYDEYTISGTANTKTVKIYWGGTAISSFAHAAATEASFGHITNVTVAASAQRGCTIGPNLTTSTFLSTSTAVAVALPASIVVKLTGQTANAADEIGANYFRIHINRG